MQQQVELMEIGCIAIFAAYNLVLYYQVRRKQYLFLSLMSFFVFMRATLIDDGSMIFFSFFPEVSLELGRKIEYFSAYIGAPLSVIFFNSLYPIARIKIHIRIFLALYGLLLLFVLVTPYSLFYHTLSINTLLVLISYILVFFILVRAIRQKMEGSLYVVVGTTLCVLFVVAELLKIEGIIFVDAGPNLVNSGYTIFIFFLSLALSEIFAKSLKENLDLNQNLERRVEEKTTEIQRSSLLRDTLIRIVSHDIRGPLSNLKSVITLVREDQVGIDQAKEFMVTIDKGVDHTIQMLDELMEWGKAASAHKKIEREEIVLQEIINPIVEHMKPHIESKNLDFSVEGDSSLVCLFDKSALRVVTRNLISNAVKFTERDGKITVRVEDVDGHIRLEIVDTGIGIPDEMKANLFEMKKDNKRPGTDNEKSSGVGLFICNDLINQNQGTLAVANNTCGKGTIFKFTLPKPNQKTGS